jgi:glutathione S-transferase
MAAEYRSAPDLGRNQWRARARAAVIPEVRAPPTFIALPLSPRSEKARWALDHHEIPYVEKAYVPMLGAPLLRWRLRRLRGQITVPILLAGGGAICLDAFDIARYAERTGHGEPLFRRGQEAEIARWNGLSDEAMHAARALVTLRAAEHGDVHDEALATVMPRGLARMLRPAAMVAARLLQRRVRVADGDDSPHRARLRDIMLELRETLSDGRRYLVGGALSYCDIAMAAALMGVQPVDAPHLSWSPASRRSSTDLELAGEFTDVLGWRDHIYAEHRKARDATRLLD